MDASTLHSCLEFIAAGTCDVYVLAREYTPLVQYNDRNLIVASNTNTSNFSGQHWCVFYIYKIEEETVCDFYDSYGYPPEKLSIGHPYRVVNYNKEKHQSDDSAYCGQLCLYFCFLRLKHSFKRTLKAFRKDPEWNEKTAQKFYVKVSKRLTHVTKESCEKFGCVPNRLLNKK